MPKSYPSRLSLRLPFTNSKIAPCADLLSGLATVALLSFAAGCGNELAPERGRGRGGPQRGGKPLQVAPTDPTGGYFVSVDAQGSGCPAGSWDTAVSPDGQVFTTSFSAYEVQIAPDVRSDRRDCDVIIKMHTPQGVSFSVTSLSYQGYASLDPSLRASFSARYGFRGLEAGSTRRDETGPYDGSFQFEDRIAQARGVWSPCGVDHELTVRTQLSLQNGRPAGTGYVNLLSVDGSTEIVLGVTWMKCRSGRAPGV